MGQTQDMDARLAYHNAGKVRSTKAYAPWTLLHVESYETRSEAMKTELWYKSPSGRRRIKQLITDAEPEVCPIPRSGIEI